MTLDQKLDAVEETLKLMAWRHPDAGKLQLRTDTGEILIALPQGDEVVWTRLQYARSE